VQSWGKMASRKRVYNNLMDKEEETTNQICEDMVHTMKKKKNDAIASKDSMKKSVKDKRQTKNGILKRSRGIKQQLSSHIEGNVS
jgi:hypothetical protein